ncbi:MAG: hypothetical protein KC933_14050 [Myxococcales bacterium]|nr:hypothetical protein [Myxococcales bacterium]
MNKNTLIGAVALFALLPSAQSYAICSSGTACPSGSSWFHELRPVPLFSSTPLDVSGDDLIYLGVLRASTPMMAACVNVAGTPTLYRIDDANDGAGINFSALKAESFFCAGPGNDTVSVLRSTYKCGAFTMDPFPYNGYALHIYGQAGRDYVYGGDGVDIICGGDGSDVLYGYGGVDDLDGWTGCDYINGGAGADFALGYDQADWLVETDPAGHALGENHNYDCLDVYSTVADADCGPGYDGVEVFSSSNHSNCEYQAYCPWDYPAHAHAMCADFPANGP